MGFWARDREDQIQYSGIEPEFKPGPLRYMCTQCNEEFSSSSDLQNHLFVQHPVIRPSLYIKYMEVGQSEVLITSPLNLEEITFNQCETVSINGIDYLPSDAARAIAESGNGVYQLNLVGRSVSSNARLVIDIPCKEDLAGVDEAFNELVNGGSIENINIENFIKDGGEFKSATLYLNGICEYLYGIKEKEGLMSSLSKSGYIERYNRALFQLEGFDRALPRLICTLIYFHYNLFNMACHKFPDSRVGQVSNILDLKLRQKSANFSSQFCVNNFDEILTDESCEEFLRIACKVESAPKEAIEECKRALKKEYVDLDKVKFQILIVEAAKISCDAKLIKNYSGYLRDNPDFRDWAMAAKALT